MTEFQRVTPAFSVAPQLALADIARAAALGFRTLVNNRPDGEAPGQPSAAEARAAAEAAGLAYHAIQFAGPPSSAVVAQTRALLAEAQAPVLAYCRSGTRSITAWALAQAAAGAESTDRLIALADAAGYNLAGARAVLDSLQPR